MAVDVDVDARRARTAGVAARPSRSPRRVAADPRGPELREVAAAARGALRGRSRGHCRFARREDRRRTLPGGLRRTSLGPPPARHPRPDAQVGRLGADPLRRRLLQAAQLDVAPVHRPRGRLRGRPARVAGHRDQDRRHPADPHRRGPARLLARPRRRPGPAEGRRREAPPGAARRAPRHPRRRPHPGPPRVPHRHRPGRPHVPRRRRPVRRGRDQAARRDRRRRAAHPLPRAPQPRPDAHRKGPSAASTPPRRSSPRPACSPPTVASPAPSSTTTPSAGWTTAEHRLF